MRMSFDGCHSSGRPSRGTGSERDGYALSGAAADHHQYRQQGTEHRHQSG